MTKSIEQLEKSLESERRLRRLDVRQTRARERGFLQERLRPLLKDAHDALHFNTPHIKGAVQRLEMALEAIRSEIDTIDEADEKERQSR